jgi:DNA modification methylase
MKVEKIQINKLKPATYNPRQISKKQYNDLKDSIVKFGLVDPIILNKDFTVIGGHQRLKVCKELKYKDIDCVVLDLTKEDERELNIRLNKSGGEFDMDILANEFDIEELTDWGFKEIELGLNIDKIIEGNTEDDHIPEVKESRVKLGDVWQLGKHRLMCGDSTKESDVKKLMNGQKADLLLTDPPYGIGIDGQKKSISKNPKHNRKEHEFRNWDNERPTKETFNLIMSYSKKHIIWGGNYFADLLPATKGWLVWDKGQKGLTMSDGELAWTSENKPLRIAVVNRNELKGSVHPTQKPLSIIQFCLKQIESETILDTYLGSGTTLIACEKTNRICYGMELDTKYCDVIIERWEQFTGQKANKITV